MFTSSWPSYVFDSLVHGVVVVVGGGGGGVAVDVTVCVISVVHVAVYCSDFTYRELF